MCRPLLPDHLIPTKEPFLFCSPGGMLCLCIHWVVQNTKHPFLVHAGSAFTTWIRILFFSATKSGNNCVLPPTPLPSHQQHPCSQLGMVTTDMEKILRWWVWLFVAANPLTGSQHVMQQRWSNPTQTMYKWLKSTRKAPCPPLAREMNPQTKIWTTCPGKDGESPQAYFPMEIYARLTCQGQSSLWHAIYWPAKWY